MCGINGVLRLSDRSAPVETTELARTRDAMASRGPDDRGEWISPAGEIALGHRRLAIIDLSEAGSQPMGRAGGRYRIVHNGEIYNYRELREELARDGVRFESESDTEVILALYERHGVSMLPRLRGMYAFALWDAAERRLLLARDPYGIKPLYYSVEEEVLRFASQVKALEASGATSKSVDPAGLVGFLIWGSVPEPWTIRRGIRALPAGHYLTVANGRLDEPRPFHQLGWDSADDRIEPEEAFAALQESVRYHLVADVPVGLFLSAGIDSALIATVAARQLDEPLTTLTLRFEAYAGTSQDEGPLAAAVAESLGARHRESWVSAADFLALWPRALAAMDQPSIDGFNTYVISKFAREAGFKVVLSGLGGDELLGGYPSFRDVPRWARWTRLGSRVPGTGPLWLSLAALAPSRPKLRGLRRYGGSLAGAYLLRRALFLPEELGQLIGRELAAEGLAAYDPIEALEGLLEGNEGDPHRGDAWQAVHLMESGQYLRNQLLRDADWASMDHSLELRVPFVDVHLRDLLAAGGFEPARSGGKRSLLRFATELPVAVRRRPKTGFSIPVRGFLEGQEVSPVGPTAGIDSRHLALRILREFGIPVTGDR